MVAVAWKIALGALPLGGLVLLVLGWRGRRVDDHPWCRKCRYDLFGSPQAQTCPECGADLTQTSSVRVGQRCHRRGMLVAGALMLATTALIGGLAVYSTATSANWNAYKPLWWLQLEARYDSDPALDELIRRVKADALANVQLDALSSLALQVQADMKQPWRPRWGALIEEIQGLGKLSDEKYQRYARQAIVGILSAQMRPRIRLGDPIPYRIITSGARVSDQGRLSFTISVREIRSAGVTWRGTGSMSSDLYTGNGSRTYGSSATPTTEQQALLKPGRYDATITVDVTVFHGPLNPRGPQLHRETMTLTAPWQLLGADQPTVELIRDPAIQRQMEDDLRNKVQLTVSPGRRSRWELTVSTPGRLLNELGMASYNHQQTVAHVFDIFLRLPNGLTHKLQWQRSGSSAEGLYAIAPLPDDFDARRVDLIFEPNLERALRSIQITKMWGDPVVAQQVPVQWPASD